MWKWLLQPPGTSAHKPLPGYHCESFATTPKEWKGEKALRMPSCCFYRSWEPLELSVKSQRNKQTPHPPGYSTPVQTRIRPNRVRIDQNTVQGWFGSGSDMVWWIFVNWKFRLNRADRWQVRFGMARTGWFGMVPRSLVSNMIKNIFNLLYLPGNLYFAMLILNLDTC